MLNQLGYNLRKGSDVSELSNTELMDESFDVIGIKDMDVLNKRGLDLTEFEFNNAYGTNDIDVLDKPTDLDYVQATGDDGTDAGSGSSTGQVISTATDLIGGLIANAKAKKQDMQNVAIKSRCGKKPFLTITKKQKAKRADYNKCVDSVLNPAPTPAPSAPPANQGGSGSSSGMSTGAIVALSLLGAVVVIGGGVLLYKNLHK